MVLSQEERVESKKEEFAFIIGVQKIKEQDRKEGRLRRQGDDG
jgi:hypothetical protein